MGLRAKDTQAIFNVNGLRWKHWGLHLHISMGPEDTEEMNEHEAQAGSLLESVIRLHGDKKRRRTKNWHLSGPKSTDGHHINPVYSPHHHPLHPTLHCSMHVLTEYAPGSYF